MEVPHGSAQGGDHAPEERYGLFERAQAVEHRSRSEVIQEAIRTHFGEPRYVPTVAERRALIEALDEVDAHPERLKAWDEVRRGLSAEQPVGATLPASR